jgi:hypothetical protein
VGDPVATGECGTVGKNLEIALQKLDPVDKGAGKMGVQFLHLSEFPGATGLIPSFQNVDIYVQPMNAAAGGDAGTDGGVGDTADSGDTSDAGPAKPTPAGAIVPISTKGLSYKDIDPATTALTIDKLAGDPAEALLVVAVHGSTPCVGGPSTACPTAVTLPFKPFYLKIKAASPTFKIDTGVNLLLGLAGSPVPHTIGDPSTFTIRIFMANAQIPTTPFPL